MCRDDTTQTDISTYVCTSSLLVLFFLNRKCPFGGDAKADSKSCPHPPTQPDVEEPPVVEEESEESEVELDMEGMCTTNKEQTK